MTKELKEITDTSNREGKHKEEYKGRMKSDRIKIRKKLSGCINPLTETGDEFSAEAARGSWLAVVSGVQSTDSGGLGLPPPSTADGYLPMTAYNTTAES